MGGKIMAKQKYEIIGREFNLYGPVLADIDIDPNPTFLSETYFYKDGVKKIIPKRLVYRQKVTGGYIMIFVYNAHPDDAGKTLPAVISLQKRIQKSLKTGKVINVFYYDTKIKRGAKTNLKFTNSDTIKPFVQGLPYAKITFNKHSNFFGLALK
ncbi:hypothetical protein KKH38_03060 [Patescibacteria group bacterium]|nr:hypothetical protein [Patescibacteria group bacterium]MBU4601076.1 hypothetical protein [Patescibacteria group bacterium]MCG2698189.1 hypothetical protein [Candidatus Parcubacteria bacterium]